jgi:protein TonB
LPIIAYVEWERFEVTSDSILNRTFALSLLLHGALVALLVFLGTRPPVFSDVPLRVRILEAPAVSSGPGSIPAPPVSPKAVEPPGTRHFSSEPSARGKLAARPPESREPGTERRAPSAERQEETKPSALTLPQVAARPRPEPTVPPTQKAPEALRDSPPVTVPERRGLTLGGPPPGISVLPQGKAIPPGGGTRPSLRDQIAGLGTGLYGDADDIGKQTLRLDSRDPEFLPYLARLKRRIQNEWVYPEEALSRGLSGELSLVFTLNKNGSMTNLRLVQSSGFPILDEEALRAIKQSAPFDPFPPQMGEEPWNIIGSFYYHLPNRFRRY